MAVVSRALALGHYDRAFILVSEFASSTVAAAFLLESGVRLDELPRGALREIVAAREKEAL